MSDNRDKLDHIFDNVDEMIHEHQSTDPGDPDSDDYGVPDEEELLLQQKGVAAEYRKGIEEGTISSAILERDYIIAKTGCTAEEAEDRARILSMDGELAEQIDYNRITEKNLAAMASLPAEAQKQLAGEIADGSVSPASLSLAKILSYGGEDISSNFEEREEAPEDQTDAEDEMEAEQDAEDYQHYFEEEEPSAPDAVSEESLSSNETSNNEASGISPEEEEFEDEPAIDYSDESFHELPEQDEQDEFEDEPAVPIHNMENSASDEGPHNGSNAAETGFTEESNTVEAQSETPSERSTESDNTADENTDSAAAGTRGEPNMAEENVKASRSTEEAPAVEESAPVQEAERQEQPARKGIMPVESFYPLLRTFDGCKNAVLETAGSAVSEQDYRNMMADIERFEQELNGLFDYYMQFALYPFGAEEESEPEQNV